MITLEGHRYIEFMQPDPEVARAAARSALYDMAPGAFDRYENPFEQKWALCDKFQHTDAIGDMFNYLELLITQASETFGLWLQPDWTRHYAGLFKYQEGDKLDVHVDAGIHPKSPSLRKHVTALLYLGDAGGPLEFWAGRNCTEEPWPGEPNLAFCCAQIHPTNGKVVLFENNDFAWHGVRAYHGEETRMVATVSFLSDRLDAFKNRRQRAFFVPRPDEKWSPEVWALRDQRAHSTLHKGVYRTGVRV